MPKLFNIIFICDAKFIDAVTPIIWPLTFSTWPSPSNQPTKNALRIASLSLNTNCGLKVLYKLYSPTFRLKNSAIPLPVTVILHTPRSFLSYNLTDDPGNSFCNKLTVSVAKVLNSL